MRHSSKTIFSLEEPQLSDFTKDHSGRSLSVMTKRQGARLAKQDYPFFNKRWRDFKSDKEEDEQATLEHSFQSQLMIAASPSDDIEQAPTSIDQSLPVHESEQDESTGEASDSDSSTSDDRTSPWESDTDIPQTIEERIAEEVTGRFEKKYIVTKMACPQGEMAIQRIVQKLRDEGTLDGPTGALGTLRRTDALEVDVEKAFNTLANSVSQQLHEASTAFVSEKPYAPVFMGKAEHSDVDIVVKDGVYVRSTSTREENKPDSHVMKDPDYAAALRANAVDDFTAKGMPIEGPKFETALAKATEDYQRAWSSLASAGEVSLGNKRNLNDLSAKVWQVLRYARKGRQNSAVSGRFCVFTLFGTILRLWVVTPNRLYSSRAYDFALDTDLPDIIRIIALLSGPIDILLPQFDLLSQTALQVRVVLPAGDSDVMTIGIEDIKVIENRGCLFGRGALICSARPKDPFPLRRLRLLQDKEILIIKVVWTLEELVDHELDVMVRLHAGPLPDDILLPRPIGKGVGDDSGRNLEAWTTDIVPPSLDQHRALVDAPLHLCCMVMACQPAKRLSGIVPPLRMMRIHRGLFKSLYYMATKGVHYRDLNLGNILVLEADMDRCLVIDFDGSRILNLNRGRRSGSRVTDLLDISIDDSRSANAYFMSISVMELHEPLIKRRKLLVEIAEEQESIEQYKAKKGDLFWQHKKEERLASLDEQLCNLEKFIQASAHRYIDDCESAVYNQVFQVADSEYNRNCLPHGNKPLIETNGRSDPRELLADLNGVTVKREFWIEGKIVKVLEKFRYSTEWMVLIGQLHSIILTAQKSMKSVRFNNGVLEPELIPLEAACFKDCIQTYDKAINGLQMTAGTVRAP